MNKRAPVHYTDLLDNPGYDRISHDLKTRGFALRTVSGDKDKPLSVVYRTRIGSIPDTEGTILERFGSPCRLATKCSGVGRAPATWADVAKGAFGNRSRVNLFVFAPDGNLSGEDAHANLIVLFPDQASIVWFEPNGVRFVDKGCESINRGNHHGYLLTTLNRRLWGRCSTQKRRYEEGGNTTLFTICRNCRHGTTREKGHRWWEPGRGN
jgi:hypothetical protein